MDRPAAYTPDTWLLIACTVLLLVLTTYGWSRRALPGAWYFTWTCLFTALWTAGRTLWLITTAPATRAFWGVFATGSQIPAVTALFCFILQFAGLDRWLTRRTLLLLSAPPFLLLGLALTNDWHHLLWRRIAVHHYVQPMRGPAGWLLVLYGSLLYLAGFPVLVWLYRRRAERRPPAALIAFGLLAGGAAFLVDPLVRFDRGPLSPLVIGLTLGIISFAVALFRFRILAPVVEARSLVIEQMRDGMLVLDGAATIVDLNPAAEQMLGPPLASVKGRRLLDVLPGGADLDAALAAPDQTSCELSLGPGAAGREYDLHISPLHDRSGAALGQLILFHEVTAEKRMQAQLIEQQRITATLHERERLARELHDSAGQVLGYASLQAQAIAKLIRDGDTERAEALAVRLAEAAQAAHHDIRETIFGLKMGSADEWSFLVALRQHLEAFNRNYGIEAELQIPAGLCDEDFGQAAGVQLLRVIQEALSNARRHGEARHVWVNFGREDGRARIVVADDGCGFDPAQPARPGNNQFGLATMRDRMAQIDGQVTIDSHPGAGTRLVLVLPCREAWPEAS